MGTPSASILDLARRLLAMEAASPSETQTRVHEAVRVCAKLQISLTRFAGADGFTSLLRRALTLARAEVPALRNIEVRLDCSILEDLFADSKDGATDAADAAVAIIAHLIELLVTFIGLPLTVRLVGESWPDALLDE